MDWILILFSLGELCQFLKACFPPFSGFSLAFVWKKCEKRCYKERGIDKYWKIHFKCDKDGPSTSTDSRPALCVPAKYSVAATVVKTYSHHRTFSRKRLLMLSHLKQHTICSSVAFKLFWVASEQSMRCLDPCWAAFNILLLVRVARSITPKRGHLAKLSYIKKKKKR